MRALLRTGMLVFAVWLGLSGLSFAKQVFLRDDSVLECESFWRGRGQIVVKVNRDVMLEFAPEEVDLSRTFPHKANAKAKAKATQPRHHVVKKPASPAASGARALGAVAPAAVKQAEATRAEAKPAGQATPTAPTAPTEPAAAIGGPAAASGGPRALAAPKDPAGAPKGATAVRPAAVQPAAAPVVPKGAQPEPTAAAAPEPSPVLSKVEYERRAKENAQQMADAIKKGNPELIKKALEAQKSLVLQQKDARKGGQSDAQGSAARKPELPWFKFFLVLVFCGLLVIVALWVVFQKAGESGWKSLIPFYNVYILMQISGKPGWWFILLLIPVVGLAVNLLAMLSLAEKFGRSPVFAVGLLLLPMFFFPLLAFGGSQYQFAVPAPEMDFTFLEEHL
jgi:hypothetical protein